MYLTIGLGDNPSVLTQPNQTSAEIWSVVHSCDCLKGNDLRYQRPFVGWYVNFDPVHSDPHEWHLCLINWQKVSCYWHVPSHRILDPRFYTPSQYCKNLVLTHILSFSLSMNAMNWLWIYVMVSWGVGRSSFKLPGCIATRQFRNLTLLATARLLSSHYGESHCTTMPLHSPGHHKQQIWPLLSVPLALKTLSASPCSEMLLQASAAHCPLPFAFFFETSCSMA